MGWRRGLLSREAESTSDGSETIWRHEAPIVLAALLRRTDDLGACEDAVQEALLAAAAQWPREGIPAHPRGWLVRVASRRLIDEKRRRRTAEQAELRTARPPGAGPVGGAGAVGPLGPDDDTLLLMLLCAHPALTTASATALTLRAVAGLSTAQIAAGFLVPEATMAQRISRAKATLREAGARFGDVPAADVPRRLTALRHVLYLAFTTGHTAPFGAELTDADLAAEAIWLTERLQRALPDDSETAGLLALMLLTHARWAGRVDAAGELVPLDQQDRSTWDRSMLARGTSLIERSIPSGPVGPFQLQAAIAAVHAEAAAPEATDWTQITMLYRMLYAQLPTPAVELNLAAAIGMAHGPRAGLSALEPLLARPDQQRQHRLFAVQGHLLELAGEPGAARAAYEKAAALTHSLPEQRYLRRRAASVGP